MLMREKTIFVIIIVILFNIQVFAGDWPQWRGSGRDGVWQEKGVVQKFEDGQLPVLWRTEIANGYSGPTIAGGRLYVTDRLTSPKEVERIHCFDAMTGDSIWSYVYECKYQKVGYPDGPRAAVTIDDGRAYSLGSMGNFFCFDAAKGSVLCPLEQKSQT